MNVCVLVCAKCAERFFKILIGSHAKGQLQVRERKSKTLEAAAKAKAKGFWKHPCRHIPCALGSLTAAAMAVIAAAMR